LIGNWLVIMTCSIAVSIRMHTNLGALILLSRACLASKREPSRWGNLVMVSKGGPVSDRDTTCDLADSAWPGQDVSVYTHILYVNHMTCYTLILYLYHIYIYIIYTLYLDYCVYSSLMLWHYIKYVPLNAPLHEVPESLALPGTITRRCEWNDPQKLDRKPGSRHDSVRLSSQLKTSTLW